MIAHFYFVHPCCFLPNGIQIHTKVFELVEVSEEDAKKAMEEVAALQKTNGHSVLQAVREDNPTQALAVLSSGQPCDPNVKDKNDITSILYATEKGMTEVCLKLLESGANPNVKDGRGNTPLLYATEKGMTEACLALIKSFFQILDNMR